MATRDEIERVAKLARLAMSPDEITEAQIKVNEVLDLVSGINDIDTNSIAPMTHSQDLTQRLREDVVTEPAAPTQMFHVPKVIE